MQACLRRTRADIIIIGLPSQLPPLTWCKIRSFQPLEPRYRWASTLSAGCLNDLILSWSSTTPLCFSRKVRGNLWQLRAAFGNSAVEAKRKGEQSSPTLAPLFNVESLGLALKNSRLREGEGQHLHPAAPVGFISQQRRGAGAKETPGEFMDPLVLGETTLEVTSQRKKKKQKWLFLSRVQLNPILLLHNYKESWKCLPERKSKRGGIKTTNQEKYFWKKSVSPVLKRFVSNFSRGESKTWGVVCFETKLVFTAVVNLVLLPRVFCSRGWKVCLDLFPYGKVAEVTSRMC